MAGVNTVRVGPGLRVGFWKPSNNGPWGGSPFHVKGLYTGPELGDFIPGQKITQELMEGTLEMRVGVLFRPDLGKRQRLETILILIKFVPEMFEYEHWEAVTG